MKTKPFVNKTILKSIPIDGNLKRYFTSKYKWLCQSNGSDFADSYFKETRQLMMSFLAASDHSEAALKSAIKSSPMRYNIMSKRLWQECLCRPAYVLNFMKLFTGNLNVKKSKHDAYVDLKSELDEFDYDHFWPSISSIPPFLREWSQLYLDWCRYKEDGLDTRLLYESQKRYGDKMAQSHSYGTWDNYWRRWRFQLQLTGDDLADIASETYRTLTEPSVHPAMYTDRKSPSSRKPETVVSRQFDQDVEAWNAICARGLQTERGDRPIESFAWKVQYPIQDIPRYAGSIDLVEKKGTNDFRPVAAPNRLLQETMKPAYTLLTRVITKFNMDATFNQRAFDTELVSWVCDPTFHPSGVDLHHATNSLPFSIGDYLVKRLLLPQIRASKKALKVVLTDPIRNQFGPIDQQIVRKVQYDLKELVSKSWDNFVTASQSEWDSPVGPLSFRKGQPLGLLPSFRTLSLTHNLLVEAMCYEMGYRDSPYRILGDDIVLKYRKVARRYRQLLSDLGVEVSEHKSYSGNLVEFAGQIYIRNQIPFHTPDHSVVTGVNAFDFSSVSTIPLRWDNLSTNAQRALIGKTKAAIRKVKASCGSSIYPKDLNALNRLTLLISWEDKLTVSAYRKAFDTVSRYVSKNAYYAFQLEGSAHVSISELFDLERVNESPLPFYSSGASLSSTGHLISYEKTYRYLDRKNQRYRRHLVAKLPAWYQDKFRPDTSSNRMLIGLVSTMGNGINATLIRQAVLEEYRRNQRRRWA